jgi:hypothetical protein
MNLHRLVADFEFNDFELADMNFSRNYIYIEGAGGGGGAIYRHLKWEIHGIFRDLRNQFMVSYELHLGSLSSFERLLITESILEEL